MKCSQVQEQTHKYLEDILSETVRSEIQSHVAGCPACEEYLGRQDDLSVDLKRQYFSPCPFDLLPILEAALALKNQPAQVTGRKRAVMICLFVFGFLLTWQYRALFEYVRNHPFSPFAAESKPAARPLKAAAAPKKKSKMKEDVKTIRAVVALKALNDMSEHLQKPLPQSLDISLTPQLQPEPKNDVKEDSEAKTQMTDKKIISYVKKACVEGECSELEVSR